MALFTFVQARNVYPQLLLARLFFSLGASAASTMVTAVLPTMSYEPTFAKTVQSPDESLGRDPASSITSDLTITPVRYQSNQSNLPISSQEMNPARFNPTSGNLESTGRISGFVGMFTGCGALIALAVFLPLPAYFQKHGNSPSRALKLSFYIVGLIAFVLAIICLFGLRKLQSESSKGFNTLFRRPSSPCHSATGDVRGNLKTPSYLYRAFTAGWRRSDIGLGYLGGFVARASSVGISLFVPLLINAAFLSSGLCTDSISDSPSGLPDIKRKCPRAYILAAQMTGVSQLVALLTAPFFGYASAKHQYFPLAMASLSGIVGYPLFASQFSPDDHDRARRIASFFAVCLIGISQIGAIVCSLASLSHGVLCPETTTAYPSTSRRHDFVNPGASTSVEDATDIDAEERTGLLSPERQSSSKNLSEFKGSVAGIYSFYGGAAILILTKAGGTLFDNVSTGAPFYIMTAFNACLLIACMTAKLAPSTFQQHNQRNKGVPDGNDIR